MSVVRHLESVATTPELRAAYNAVQPKVSAFYSSLPLNEGLWKAIQRYAATSEARALTGTDAALPHQDHRRFKRHGAELDPAGKGAPEGDRRRAGRGHHEILRKCSGLDQRLGSDPHRGSEARGSAAERGGRRARLGRIQGHRDGWRFTLQAPSYLAVMTYLDDARVREQVWRAFNTRAASGRSRQSPADRKILALRNEKARLLGFRDFADLVLDDRMAHTGERAQNFLEDLRAKTEPRFREENQELDAFAGRELQPWDIGYWAEKQRAALYDFDEEALRPYFPLERVVDGMFDIFGRVFGIRVSEEPGVPAWDPAGPHATRFTTAATNQLSRLVLRRLVSARKQARRRVDGCADHRQSGRRHSPHLGLICGNLTPPVDGKPALLTHREVETIFHEFGHLLHHLLSRVEVRSLAGTSVAWDFVELPSQIMENWCWERESLDLFARHWETGAPIPEDLFQKMKRAKTFRAANTQMRQLGFGYVDLALHREWDGNGRRHRLFARTILQTILARAAAAGSRHDRRLHAPVREPGRLRRRLLFLQMGRGAGRRRVHALPARKACSAKPRAAIFAKRFSRAATAKIRRSCTATFMGRDPDPNALLERAGLLVKK